MYLSRLVLDPAKPRAGRALARPYLLHQAVMAGFDPEERGDTRVLFRIEPERPPGRVILLVQSEAEPQWNRASERFFGPLICAQMKELRIALSAGQRLRFRLRANPTVKREGKRLGLYGEERQRLWLQRKFDQGGVSVGDFRVVDEGLTTDRDPPLELQSALYEGSLVVRDPGALMDAVRAGIGTGKAFGFGLLSLARAGAI
jgi:CRISPR system Cascade subunit CasE